MNTYTFFYTKGYKQGIEGNSPISACQDFILKHPEVALADVYCIVKETKEVGK